MKKTLLLLFFISIYTFSQGQHKEVALVFKTNISKLRHDIIYPGVGFEIGVNLKYPLWKKMDWVTGGTFRLMQYTNDLGRNEIDRTEQLFHIKIPLEISYRITPNRWRTHLGIWSAFLIAADVGRSSISTKNERDFYSKFLFGPNVGISHSFPKGFEVSIDYSYAFSGIYARVHSSGLKRTKRFGLDLISIGVLIPLKNK